MHLRIVVYMSYFNLFNSETNVYINCIFLCFKFWFCRDTIRLKALFIPGVLSCYPAN